MDKNKKETFAQREQLKTFKGAGWGTSQEEWDRLRLEVLLDIKDLLIEVVGKKDE